MPAMAQELEPGTQALQGGWKSARVWLRARRSAAGVGGCARAAESGLRFVEGDVGDVGLGGGEVGDGLAGGMVAPGAGGVEVGDEVGGELGGESFAGELVGETGGEVLEEGELR